MAHEDMIPTEVSQSRLTAFVEQLGSIGAQPGGGIIRPQYSQAWREAQDLVSALMKDAGLKVHEDAVGNVFGRLTGYSDDGTVLVGSHVDTVSYGGAYDGALGVLAAIAAVEAATKIAGQPRRNVEVVSLCEEEGSRFHGNYFGTRAILGMVEPDEAEHLVDAEGITLAEAARSVGCKPEKFVEARRDDLALFLELHIEQGRVLVDAGVNIGIVDVITGVTWIEVTVEGRTDHAGATAMTDRVDAFQGAARMAIAVEELALKEGPPTVATTGVVRLHPGGTNIVPGRAEFTVDVRHPDLPTLDDLVKSIRGKCEAVADERHLEVHVEVVKRTLPHRLDERTGEVFRSAANVLGASWHNMPSGAGHDSQTMGTRIPSAMLFVPSIDGRSHSPAEYSTPEDCARGASVLATALRSIAW